MNVTPDKAPLLEYPCVYTFKAIGLSGDAFVEHVRKLVSGKVGYVNPDSCSVRESGKGKYQSVSVLVQLDTEEQRRAVYQAFWEDERVVFYL